MAKQTFVTGQVLTAAQMTALQQTAMGGGSTTAKTASYVLVAADAGTVVQMNAAGATTITVNTALFAAGDSVQIQNIGAGVCTVTAGTATVSTAGSLALSQYEGGQLYFNTTSAALFFDIVQSSGMTNPMTTTGDIIYSSSGSTPARLGIGTTGQVVTVASGLPSWATPAAALALVTSGTFSSVTSFSVNNCFSATYKNYQIFINPTSTSATNTLKLRVSGTDSSTGWYTGSIAQPCNGGAVASSGGANSASWPLGLFQSGYAQNISLQNPFIASLTSVSTIHTDTNGAAGNFNIGGGWHEPATSYDGFTITLASSGSGSYYVYGYGV